MITQEFKFNSDKLTIDCFFNGHTNGDIDLEQINSCAEMLDWIFHMHQKTSPQEFYMLLDLFGKIFHPQENCCSWGEEKKFSGSDLAKKFARKQ
jgi:hypothetical protein